MTDPLDDLLRTMPREQAPDDFARAVLARVKRPPEPRPRLRLAVAGAVAAALLVAGGTWLSGAGAGERELRAEIASLRDQHQQLQHQLTELRQRLSAPTVVVGGNDRVDYVLDLERLSSGISTASDGELIWVPRQSTGGSL